MNARNTIDKSNLSIVCCLLCFFALGGPANGQFTTVLNLPPDPNIVDEASIGSDTQVNLFDAGMIGYDVDAGSPSGASTNIEVNVFGGSVDSGFHANGGSTVNISGGTVGSYFEAFDGSIVNIFGGVIGQYLFAQSGSTVNISGGHLNWQTRAYDGSTINISGGSVGGALRARSGGTVNISGGTVDQQASAEDGGTINISGGSFGNFFRADPGSTINLSGGEFRLDGVLIGGLDTVGDTLAFDIPAGSLLSGTLADGTPFGFSISALIPLVQDRFASGSLTLHAAALPAIGPATITTPDDPVPLGIRAGQTLVVEDGGAVGDHFNAGWGSTVEVTGGQVGENFEAVGATVNISGGQIGEEFDVYQGSCKRRFENAARIGADSQA